MRKLYEKNVVTLLHHSSFLQLNSIVQVCFLYVYDLLNSIYCGNYMT